MGIDHVVVRQKDAAQTPSKNMETKFQSIKEVVEDWLPFTKAPISVWYISSWTKNLRTAMNVFFWVVTNLHLYFLFKFLYRFRMASSLSIISWDRLCVFAEKDSNWREHKNLTKIMPKMQNFIIQPDQLRRVHWIVLARKRSIKCNS